MNVLIILLGAFFTVCARAQIPPPDSSEIESTEHFRGRGFRRGFLPPFADGASDEAKKQLKEIFKNKELTKAQINEKVQEWVKQQDDTVQKAYEEFEKKMDDRKNEMQAKVESASVSPEMKSVLTQMEGLFSNETITPKQERDAVKDILRNLSPDQRQQFREFFHGNKQERR
ncbi:hypothetical protein Tcan_09939 [Toxocara canis]|uniref:SXP/RAL-2 family protein Ani s 5-like cation-binding domain-containing protein n=2 Tax=Toxocara canis TaxID=6265 RepID=A0A0B2V4F2_TOXCA|nr:hypothetical protein Tcan_09939 [Toxocara canis]VDM46942.1 unnamed protein product [Toxocara canis]